MKYNFLTFFLIFCMFYSEKTVGQPAEGGNKTADFKYISPVPGSEYIHPDKTIALRHGDVLDVSSLQDFEFMVSGSVSGNHQGEIVISDDQRTIIFKPESDFQMGETVQVKTNGNAMTQSGALLKNVNYTFQVTSQIPALPEEFIQNMEFSNQASLFPHHQSKYTPLNKAAKDNNLPEDFPELTVEVMNASFDNGYYFVSPFGHWGWFPDNVPYTIAFDDQGIPVYYQRQEHHCYDFKWNPNGKLSYLYNEYPAPYYKIMNSELEVIDTYTMPEGYVTDFHEFLMLENDHVFIMAYDPQIVDMSQYVPGGVEDAVVSGWVFLELDASKNVVLEWRSWDHYDILDAEGYVNLQSSTIDLVHGNAIEVTDDNALLLSPRNLNEITKVDRNTGEIIWRLNGNNNMFEFINDTLGFSWQHDCRILNNGNLSIFDNGSYHPDPKFSSMVEYEMDEENFTATLVRRIRNNPDSYGVIMGSARETENGNIVCGWGSGVPGVTEFDGDGNIASTYYFAGVNYRAYRYPWTTDYFETNKTELNFGYIWMEDQKTKSFNITNNQQEEIQVTSYHTHSDKFIVENELPIVMQAGEVVTIEVTFIPGEEGSFSDVLTLNSDINSETLVQRIAQQVKLIGHATEGQGIGDQEFSNVLVSPNPVKNKLKLTFDDVQDDVKLTVLSLTGQKVMHASWSSVSTGVLDMTSLHPGVYFVEIRSAKGVIKDVLKIVKE